MRQTLHGYRQLSVEMKEMVESLAGKLVEKAHL
jgi:hypothetical protein